MGESESDQSDPENSDELKPESPTPSNVDRQVTRWCRGLDEDDGGVGSVTYSGPGLYLLLTSNDNPQTTDVLKPGLLNAFEEAVGEMALLDDDLLRDRYGDASKQTAFRHLDENLPEGPLKRNFIAHLREKWNIPLDEVQ